MSQEVQCEKCGVTMDPDDAAAGMNLGWGPMYFCYICMPPPGSVEEALGFFENAINPPKEMP